MDTNIKIQILILVLGVLIGASGYLINSFILWNTSVNKDKADIAEGLYLDVSWLEDYLIATNQELLNNPDGKYIFVHVTPLYPDNGLYFAYQRDIFKMDRNIAKDTFAFYNHLLSAERDRSLIYEIQRIGDMRDITTAERIRQQALTRNVACEVNETVNLLPALKRELYAAT
ncbi:MAG: hypothetical protein CVV33_02565 [Methanomicrobiales archaeon HGW-Methanomicrobiales-4]|nr:MAG: hypothetical protein CVV33_02565 [Methanomicrobiales archaeon HGW-Methanomicrobiales-4]